MRLTILGGSSPFTIGFFQALAAQPCPAIREITLFGRDCAMMAALCRLAGALLPQIAFNWTDRAQEACDGYDIVIHQIRYGGLAGRAEDEAVAIAAGAVPDESLGPGGANAARRMAAPLRAIAEAIARGSATAHVINLTNPLGLSTSLMHRAGIPNPIGICELPQVTAMKVASLLDIPFDTLEWHYSGLNHRGFLHHLSVDGADVLPVLTQFAPVPEFAGLDREQLVKLGGIPTKYFKIFARGEPVSAPGRADELAKLRDTVGREIAEYPSRQPPSLARRAQPWWGDAVVPLIHALVSDEPARLVLDLVRQDGITCEGICAVTRDDIHWLDAPRPSAAILEWIERFTAEESESLAAI